MFRRLIYEKSGIALNESKKELLRTRLRARIEREGFSSYRQYLDFVRDDKTGQALVPLLDDISTNLTSFYREINHFNLLRKILPEWIANKRREGDMGWRIWSAGCSTGEEPYTLAFVMLEFLEHQIRQWNLKILATDLSVEVLKQAAEGKYDIERLKDVPQHIASTYFTRGTGDMRTKSGKILHNRPVAFVADEVREMITFRRFNLMEPRFPFKRKFDFIFCRNVMIYFDKPTQETLVNKYYDVLQPGGYLFIGHSESLTGLKHNYKYVQPTVYQK
ncbi:MAG: methyltransferase domain-containing protein [Nitrospinae bacterium]|nr:methyltransferase domain-containing protein [Nitrospinota bacterium]